MDLEREGYTVIADVISAAQCQHTATQVAAALAADRDAVIHGSVIHGLGRQQSSRGVVGGRNLLAIWKNWGPIVRHPAVAELIHHYVGPAAGLVRGLYFDKPPGQGWALALHRDRTIAVAEHRDPPQPFSKPTRKSGVPHVAATRELLESMLTIRLHLDPMCDQNGPLVVIPGSHYEDDEGGNSDAVTIHCQRGDLFVMRPLLVHGSRASEPDTEMHRRVIHLEIAPNKHLPGGYSWHQFEAIF